MINEKFKGEKNMANNNFYANNNMVNNGAMVAPTIGQAMNPPQNSMPQAPMTQPEAPQGQQQNRRPHEDVNNVILSGRLCSDCNYRQGQPDATRPGQFVNSQVFFNLAVNRGFTRNDGSEAVSFISCSIRGRRADALAPYLTKGLKVFLTGQLSTWNKKLQNGQYENGYVVECDKFDFIDRPKNDQQSAASTPQTQAPYQQTMQAQPQYQQMPYQQNAMPQQPPVQQYQQQMPYQSQPVTTQPQTPPAQNPAPPAQPMPQPVAPAPQAQAQTQTTAPQQAMFSYENNPFAGNNASLFSN